MPTLQQEKDLFEFLTALEQFSRHKHFFSRLNVFEAAGMQRQEIRHSNFLAFLLRPQEAHGLSDRFLKQMVAKILKRCSSSLPPLKPIEAALASYSDAIVSREWRDIDILAVSKKANCVLAIENKIDSSESKNQLAKYEAEINSEYPSLKKLFAFLTKEGVSASSPVWVSIGYKDVLDALVEARGQSSELSQEAAIVIDHYMELIRRNIVPDQELVDICKALYAKHRAAIDLILQYGEVNAFEVAANEFFESHPELTLLARRSSAAVFLPSEMLPVIPQISGTDWWGQERPLAYWFNLQTEKLGLVLEVGPIEESTYEREKLARNLLDYFKTNTKKIYPRYTRVYSDYKKVTDDQLSDPKEIKKVMEDLYVSVVTKHIGEVKNIAQQFFSLDKGAMRSSGTSPTK